MIVRDRPSGFKMFLLLRGSILPRILPSLLATTLIATVVTLTHGDLFELKITLTTIPFSLIGLPLAIFLGFRNSAAYDRYWEGRKLWGELVLRCRSLSRQCQSFVHAGDAPEQALEVKAMCQRMAYRAIGFVHGLRLQLRDCSDYSELKYWMPEAEWPGVEKSSCKSDAIMLNMGKELGQCGRKGWIDPCLSSSIDLTLSVMTAAAAADLLINVSDAKVGRLFEVTLDSTATGAAELHAGAREALSRRGLFLRRAA